MIRCAVFVDVSVELVSVAQLVLTMEMIAPILSRLALALALVLLPR